MVYALSDVTHLRPAYEKLKRKLARTGREHWLEEEIAVLTDPATYRVEPEESWKRLKVRTDKPRFLAILKEISAWREREAQRKTCRAPHPARRGAAGNRVHAPTTVDDLARTRGLGRSVAEGRWGTEMLAAVERGVATPTERCPTGEPRIELPPGLTPIVELLRVLLKMKCEDEQVASKLVANSGDLEAIAADDNAAVPALKGWRRGCSARRRWR